jgi:hypothetical protein
VAIPLSSIDPQRQVARHTKVGLDSTTRLLPFQESANRGSWWGNPHPAISSEAGHVAGLDWLRLEPDAPPLPRRRWHLHVVGCRIEAIR